MAKSPPTSLTRNRYQIVPAAELGTEAFQVIMVATGAGEGTEGVSATLICAEDIAANASPATPVRMNCKLKLAISPSSFMSTLGVDK
jgi:hypothetical protein